MKLTVEKLRLMLSAMEELRDQAEQTEVEAREQLAVVYRNIWQLQRLLDQAAANCSSIAVTNRDQMDDSAECIHGSNGSASANNDRHTKSGVAYTF